MENWLLKNLNFLKEHWGFTNMNFTEIFGIDSSQNVRRIIDGDIGIRANHVFNFFVWLKSQKDKEQLTVDELFFEDLSQLMPLKTMAMKSTNIKTIEHGVLKQSVDELHEINPRLPTVNESAISSKDYNRPQAIKKVFFSYSKKNKTTRDELDIFLSPLKKKIHTWHDYDIMPGAKWNDKIKAELHDADIVLCLVSADFLATDYIMDVELPIMLKRHKKGELVVIPIILRPCGWEYTILSEFNALPRKGKPITQYDNKDAAFLEVLNGINRVIELNT